MPKVPVIVCIFGFALVAVVAYSMGYVIGSEDGKAPNYCNGWLIRPLRHLWCGMIHGHEYKSCAPMDNYGHAAVRCTRCGKEKGV